ncbi:MAG TPA: hypothetical protein PKY59_20085, partial [Pyrinomonadaceae bacterium]|nr:hypothetical protein [Pyrinomonadaceae bacterium]
QFGLFARAHRPASSRVFKTFTPRNSADGQPWLATASSVNRFNGTAWELVEGLPETLALSEAEVAVSSLNVDNNGQLWTTFRTVGQGAATFAAASGQWHTVSCPISGPASPYIRHITQTARLRIRNRFRRNNRYTHFILFCRTNFSLSRMFDQQTFLSIKKEQTKVRSTFYTAKL